MEFEKKNLKKIDKKKFNKNFFEKKIMKYFFKLKKYKVEKSSKDFLKSSKKVALRSSNVESSGNWDKMIVHNHFRL